MRACALWALSLAALPAHASLLPPELEDGLANVISWVALIIAPIIGITVFWLVHILPEKIAEKRRHPQVKAIQTLCLLSLFFGGLLWPLAWLWAYTKPVLHKMAYGTDVDDTHGHGDDAAAAPAEPAAAHPAASKAPEAPRSSLAESMEVMQLRQKVAALEAQLAASREPPKGGDV